VQEKRACKKCVPAAKWVALEVREGLPEREIERRYADRFDATHAKSIPADGSPAKGADAAPVTLVEFADFECPYCGKMFEKLRDVYRQNHDHVRIVYKFYPLPTHPHADLAAKAGIAAMKQGKFWEMHDKMFQNQQRLELTDLEAYARELGLDLARFHADFESDATSDRIQRDRKLADTLGVQATPTIFVNGHPFDLKQDIREWVAEEIAGSTQEQPTASEAPRK
jgi:protein-disulfide isomerase